MTLEMYEDMWAKRAELRVQVQDLEQAAARGASVTSQVDAIYEQINAINVCLNEPAEDYDPLIAQWERDIKEGRDPDLTAGMHG